MKEKILLIKLKQIVGVLYLPAGKPKGVVINMKGGPGLGDTGSSSAWEPIKLNKYALFIPDYIGFCRSDGDFNFKSCIETIYESEDFFSGKFQATDINTMEKFGIEIPKMVLYGSSWGGAIVPFLDKYKKSNITTIVMSKPVTDWSKQGRTKYKEENLELTNESIKFAWGNIYRGYAKSEWPEIFSGKLQEFNPVDNTQLLRDKKVYIYHGNKDDVINFRQTKSFVKKLTENNIHHMFRLIDGDHGSEFNYNAFINFFKDFKDEK